MCRTKCVSYARRGKNQQGNQKVYKDLRDEVWIDPNTGETHERQKDYGFNHQYVVFADAINPLDVITYTVISWNPIDYWLMSNGDTWRSCHTIDKNKVLGNPDPNHNYSGQYCSGTESYMLDESSVIVYTVSADYDGEDFELQPKQRRQVFAFNEDFDMFCQSRLYPDGRSISEGKDGDKSISGQLRAVVEKVLCECLNIDNDWKIETGTTVCADNTMSCGTHYRDYTCYNDGVIAKLKENGVAKSSYPKIRIGHDPICPCCGDEHCNEDTLLCDDCDDVKRCEYCGGTINRCDELRIGDYVYCCAECAERDGYVWCENTERWVWENDAYVDDYTGEHFEWDDYSIKLDNYCYSCVEHAEANGWRYLGNDEWVSEDNIIVA